MSRWIAILLLIVCVFAIAHVSPATLNAAETSSLDPTTRAAEAAKLAAAVQPLLARHCFACHGPDKAEAGLKLSQKESAFGSRDGGAPAIVPGHPEKSELLARITSKDADERMPPKSKPLKPAEIEVVRRWIEVGAPWRGHWAFEPPQPQQPPKVTKADWVTNPIDAFILARLEENGLTPAPPADKATLLRRAYFDLTGLPPTPEEVVAFLADTSPDAYAKVIDRLLASPHYGEKWGRHWLDLVRFADTNSFERDGIKQNAWRFRDYVIRSFNDDKPYDQFVREQLAGDELPLVTPDSIAATGYYRLGLWDDEPADRLQARYDELDDIVATTGQVFLGLTINCARCHDHKIDPISQVDYYGMLAAVHEIRPFGEGNQVDMSSPQIVARYEEMERKLEPFNREIHELEQRGITKMSAEDQRKSEGKGRDKLLAAKLVKMLEPADWASYSELRQQRAAAEAELGKLPARETTLGIKCLPKPPETFIFARGNPHVPGKSVTTSVPAIFKSSLPEIKPPADGKTSGRRLALANWIASPDNMLTSRVMANRVWQYHFGRGIVRSSSNFGNLGDSPTHPELLDWLAAELVRNNWQLKPLHRLLMLSSAYRQSSRGNSEALAKDSLNDLFWRFDIRRLTAEEVRDSILAATGTLNDKMYGPGVYPEISKQVMAGQSVPGAGWGHSSPEEAARRSIYIHAKRSLITPILADFDFADTDGSCPVRFATTQPAQALSMLNGEFANQMAGKLLERIRRDAGDQPPAQIKRALWLIASREPDAKTVDRSLKLLQTLADKHHCSPDAAMKYFCLMALNLNEFVFLD